MNNLYRCKIYLKLYADVEQGRVCSATSCAVHGRVYVAVLQYLVLSMDVSVLQHLVLSIKVSVLQHLVLSMNVSVLQHLVLPMDVSVLQHLVLSMNVSVLQHLVLSLRCLFYSIMCCAWTCLFYSILCCPGRWTLDKKKNKTCFVGHPKANSQCILDIIFEVKPLQAHSQTVNHLTFKLIKSGIIKIYNTPPLIFLQGARGNDVRF